MLTRNDLDADPVQCEMEPMDDVILLDGGTGRELKRIGAPFAQPEWSALALIEAPDFVSRVHDAYVAAGADVITTNSYAVVPFHIGAERFAERGMTLAGLAGRLAREAAERAGRPVTVAGSLPPVCGSYRPDLFDPAAARPILETLVAGLAPFIDVWLAETLSDTREADVVRAVIGDDPRPLWLSFTLADGAAESREAWLRSGQTVGEAVDASLRLGASAVLFNCSQPEVMAGAVVAAGERLQRKGAETPLGVYANAFPPQREDATANETLHDIRADLAPEGYLAFARSWRAHGARIIGGCCGIGPEHIAAMRAA
jgi:S-methylmethionine-dependent homocysteine/selenocysteine methylase